MQETGRHRGTRARRCGRSTGCKSKQLLDEPGDWRVEPADLQGGGWAFQFANSYYPDLDDTAVVAWAMHQARNAATLRGKRNAGARLARRHAEQQRRVCLIRCRQHLLLSQRDSIRRSRRAARSADERCHRARRHRTGAHRAAAGQSGARARDRLSCATSRKPDGSWFGRWGTNYIYGTWSVLTRIRASGHPPTDDAAVRRAVSWLRCAAECRRRLGREQRQLLPSPHAAGLTTQPAPLIKPPGRCSRCSRRARSDRTLCGAASITCCARSRRDGLWSDPNFTAPGFPARVLSQVSRLLRIFSALGAGGVSQSDALSEPLIECGRDRRRARGGGAHSRSRRCTAHAPHRRR